MKSARRAVRRTDKAVSHGIAAAQTVHRISGPGDQVVWVIVQGIPIIRVIVCCPTVNRSDQTSSSSLVVHVGVVQEDRVKVYRLV